MKKVLQLLFLCVLLSVVTQAQVKLASFSGSNGADNLNPQDNPIEANNKDIDITSFELSRGVGITYTNNSSYSYVGAMIAGTTDKNSAHDAGSYYKLKLVTSAKIVSLSNLVAKLRTANATASANLHYVWAYSFVENANSAGYVNIGSPEAWDSKEHAGNGVEVPEVNLSGVGDLQNISPNTTIYFRLYVWGTVTATETQRGFGFGKSYAASTNYEVLTINGYTGNAVPLMNWSFTGINANSSTTVNANYQSPAIKQFGGGVGAVTVGRGNGLAAGGLANAFAVRFVNPTPDVPEAQVNQAYYVIPLQGNATDYTQILGYRMKFRRNSSTAVTSGRWILFIGDVNNQITGNSETKLLDNADINFTDNTDGNYYELTLTNDDVSVVIPPGKNAELRLFLWGSTATDLVFGLGRVEGINHLQIYGKTMTPAEYLQVLPVSLTSFKATKQSNSVRLNWATASEQNNSHFNVLRAGNDKNFVGIGKINGNGTTNTAKEYSLTDYRPLAGANYYKLTQTDLDGKVNEVGEVQYVQFDLNATSLVVLSQLDQSTVKAILNATKADKANISIYNISGNVLYQTQLNVNSGVNEIVAPVSLSKGLYFLKVKTQSGDAWQAKFVK